MKFQFRDRNLDFDNQVALMGILNVTPDSFSENGTHFSLDAAVSYGLKMVADRADIIDIGGESSRPGAQPVSYEEEKRRVIPVIRALRDSSDIPISVDTVKAKTARAALEAGADIINDISGFNQDSDMKHVAKEYRAGCIAMHMRGTPQTMQDNLEYTDIFSELSEYFQRVVESLTGLGINRESICIDPGIGFSKSAAQNLALIRHLDRFNHLECPILVGPSRKSFIGAALDIPIPADRIWGTAAAVSCAVCNGAKIIRVHDVREMRDVIDMTAKLMNS